MNFYFISWCLICFLSIIFELFSPGLFFFLSFAVGAVSASILSLFFADINIQLFGFIIVTILSLFLLRYYVKKSLKKQINTNFFALVGKRCLVIKEIDAISGGMVKIDGEIWSAKSDVNITVNSEVEVINVKGSHVIVKKL